MKSKDNIRVDFLGDKNLSQFEFVNQMGGGVYVFGKWAEYLGGNADRGVYFKSLRKAIDACMRKARQPQGARK